MYRILAVAACLMIAAIDSVTLVRGDDLAPGGAKSDAPYTYKLTKRDFDPVGRANFTLDITLKRPDLAVVAWCDLRDEQQQGIGRFSLGNVNAEDADAPVRFRINCLASAYVNKSTLRVELREKKTNKHVGVLELSLRDAVLEVVKER